jgi:predicted ABC-type ATPase
MFAGPNGSGKSTLKEALNPHWLGIYLNADDIKKALREQPHSLDLSVYGIESTEDELISFFQNSQLLEIAGLLDSIQHLRLKEGIVTFGPIEVNSYHAAVLADFVRQKLLAACATFSFETVMSGPDKIDLLCKTRRSGYRTYLYFVATEDPTINIARVALRVQLGGHDVPDKKVIERYERSLAKLLAAIRCTDRAYIFDNTGEELIS